ncbi:MAG: hypothetical protein AABX98_00325 [Nanoarchaeota archaeon]
MADKYSYGQKINKERAEIQRERNEARNTGAGKSFLKSKTMSGNIKFMK